MKRRIVLDTNCLLQIISRKSKNYFLWNGFLNGDYWLCYTTEGVRRIIGTKANPVIASMVLNIICEAPNTLRVDARYHWNLITEDSNDNKFVDCAIFCNADYIVSEDKHFKVLKKVKFLKVFVIRLEEFARLFRTQEQ